MSRYLHYLRIAFTAFCGVMAVLLVVLWVRSFTNQDSVEVPQALWRRPYKIISSRGYIGYMRTPTQRWWKSVRPHAFFFPGKGYMIPGETGYFDGDGNPMTRAARLTMSKIVPIIPDLLLVTFFAAVATVPWLPWWSRRFSLRTLLLACTAVAVVLGLIVWLAHR